MVRLTFIEKNRNIISAFYDPESSGQLGKIVLDMSTGDVVEKIISDYEGEFHWHYHHALNALKELGRQEHPPTEYTVAWY